MNDDNHNHLILMANQIGQFFATNGESGSQSALEHIQKFWAPSMRHDMRTLLQTEQTHGLSEFMRNALQDL